MAELVLLAGLARCDDCNVGRVTDKLRAAERYVD